MAQALIKDTTSDEPITRDNIDTLDCTIEHEGRKCTANGAWYDGQRAVAYVGKTLGDGMGVDRHGPTSRRALTDWHGNQIGTCALTSSWRVRSYIGCRMYQIYATINGVDYTGRGFGEGMSVVLRRCAKQRS